MATSRSILIFCKHCGGEKIKYSATLKSERCFEGDFIMNTYAQTKKTVPDSFDFYKMTIDADEHTSTIVHRLMEGLKSDSLQLLSPMETIKNDNIVILAVESVTSMYQMQLRHLMSSIISIMFV
jgi:hypothetical protein